MNEFDEDPQENPRDRLFDTALALIEDGDFHGARVPLKDLIEMEEGNYDAYYYLGLLSKEEDDLEGARIILRHGLERAEKDLGDLRNGRNGWLDEEARKVLKMMMLLAQVMYEDGDLDESHLLVSTVLEINPTDNLNGRFLAGLIAQRRENLEAAIRCYEDSEPTAFRAYNLALALYDSGEISRSLVEFRLAIISNIYIAPLILGREPPFSFETEAVNTACRIDARAFERQSSDLWANRPEVNAFLGKIFEDKSVVAEVEEYIRLFDQLQQEGESFENREEVEAKIASLGSTEHLMTNNEDVLGRVRDSLFR